MYIFVLILLGAFNANAQPTARSGNEIDPYIKNEVKNTIVKHAADIQSCYLNYLASTPSVKEGKVKIDWQITPPGKPIKVELVHSDFTTKTINDCVLKKISAIEFPPTGKDFNKYVAHEFYFKEEKK